MKEIWNWVQAALTALGGFLGWFLGGFDGFLYALVALMIADYITGVTVSYTHLLGAEENREVLQIILTFMEKYKVEAYNEETHTGLVRHVLIRKGFTTKEMMVCLVINGKTLPHSDELVRQLNQIEGMTSIDVYKRQR